MQVNSRGLRLNSKNLDHSTKILSKRVINNNNYYNFCETFSIWVSPPQCSRCGLHPRKDTLVQGTSYAHHRSRVHPDSRLQHSQYQQACTLTEIGSPECWGSLRGAPPDLDSLIEKALALYTVGSFTCYLILHLPLEVY